MNKLFIDFFTLIQRVYRRFVGLLFHRKQYHEQVRLQLSTLSENRSDAPGEFRLSIIVPAYKESGIAATVSRLRSELLKHVEKQDLEIIVVDDGSQDDTAQYAIDAGADQTISFPKNRGKGAAIRAGVLVARGRCVAFTDADLSYSPDQIIGLLEKVEQGWDVVVGSRRHVDTTTLVQARRIREIGGRIINSLTHVVLLGQHRDTQCGLKAFRSDAANQIFSHTRVDGFAFDVEVFHLVERYRLSLYEVPVKIANSSTSTVRVLHDAMQLLIDLYHIRYWAYTGVYDNPSIENKEQTS